MRLPARLLTAPISYNPPAKSWILQQPCPQHGQASHWRLGLEARPCPNTWLYLDALPRVRPKMALVAPFPDEPVASGWFCVGLDSSSCLDFPSLHLIFSSLWSCDTLRLVPLFLLSLIVHPAFAAPAVPGLQVLFVAHSSSHGHTFLQPQELRHGSEHLLLGSRTTCHFLYILDHTEKSFCLRRHLLPTSTAPITTTNKNSNDCQTIYISLITNLSQ